MPSKVSRAQSITAADATALLQYLIQSGPPRFQEKAEFLLQCFSGTLVVIIKRDNNMKQSVGNPSVYCKLTLGNTPPRQTTGSEGIFAISRGNHAKTNDTHSLVCCLK